MLSVRPLVTISNENLSGMIPLVRTFAIGLLCGVASLGHAPAWLHVAVCDHGGPIESSFSSEAAETAECNHTCCHRDDEKSEFGPNRSSSETPGHSHGSHDSDSCLICQSLGLANGVAWKLDFGPGAQDFSEFITSRAATAPTSSFLSIPHSRGPPA
jgi:hypothetical protein